MAREVLKRDHQLTCTVTGKVSLGSSVISLSRVRHVVLLRFDDFPLAYIGFRFLNPLINDEV